MTAFSLTAYRGHDIDGTRIIAFLSEINQIPGNRVDFHVGDFCWQGWRGFDRKWEDSLGVIEASDGSIAGLSWFDTTDEVETTLHPRYEGSAAEKIYSLAIDFGVACHEAVRIPESGPLSVLAVIGDSTAESVLTHRGYRDSGERYLIANKQSLDYEIPERALPDGFEYVAMTDEADFAERVDIHREIWNPSKLVLEGYEQLRTAPIYDPELDLVIRSQDGKYVAYVHGWYDPVSKIGLLEPVGCREAFRGKGLTGKLVREVLRRFQQRGATEAWVGSEPDEVPANALYLSTGFKPVAQLTTWKPEAVTLEVSRNDQ